MHENHETPLSRMILLACATAICLLTAVPAATAEGERPKLEESDLKKLRKQAANRPRRIVYNDDGCHGPSRNTPQELLACRVRQVTDTQVDTICYCTGGGGLFWAHQPNVGEVLGASVEEGHAPYVKQMRDGLVAMKKQGTDPLAVVVEHGHKHEMEVFWSYRMNNPECSFVSWALSKRKRNNPQYIMGVQADWKEYPLTDPKAWWTLSDFERAEVREHIVRIFEDICQRYDIDGVELDFIRHPLFFRPNLEGKPVEPRHIEMMTEMLRHIRAVTERESIKRGRPILVTIRAPLSVKSCLDIGLDMGAYLEEDLVDILIAGLVQGDEITITYNEHPVKTNGPVEPLSTEPSSAWFYIETDPKLAKAGYNLIDLQLDTTRSAENRVVLNALDLVVSYVD